MIIDGIISIAITLPQIILLPEVPSRLTANFMFSEAEVQLAKDRHPKEGRAEKVCFTLAQVCINHEIARAVANTVGRSKSGLPHQRFGSFGLFQCMHSLDSFHTLVKELTQHRCNMIGMQPSLSLNFWFKGWNTIKPGSFTIPQISAHLTSSPIHSYAN